MFLKQIISVPLKTHLSWNHTQELHFHLCPHLQQWSALLLYLQHKSPLLLLSTLSPTNFWIKIYHDVNHVHIFHFRENKTLAVHLPTGCFSLTVMIFWRGCITTGALSFSSRTVTSTVAVAVCLGTPPSTASTSRVCTSISSLSRTRTLRMMPRNKSQDNW